MKIKIVFSITIIIILNYHLIGQEDNLPYDHRVYDFLKEMRVKKIIKYLRDDNLVLSRNQILDYLSEIENKSDLLSNTEKKLLTKFKDELSDNLDKSKATQLLNSQEKIYDGILNLFTNKKKYLFAIKEDENSIFLEGIGHLFHGQRLKPAPTTNSNLFDIGFRLRGSVFKNLGYNLTVIKGGVSGNSNLSEKIEPRLLSNFKWVENIENIGNYGFNYGYLRLNTKPYKNMNIALQVGREDFTFGYGYGNKLVISGNNPTLDFIKFDFDYKQFHITSIHASTVGEFAPRREDRYTKYISIHKLKFASDNFEFGMGESVIYSGRGMELGYLSPIAFYKFIEMDIQDRDNGNVFLDFKTNPIENFELQATFFLDENILNNLQDFERYTNKTAYQIGAFWYQPFNISDLSIMCEYTKIRPYVYTHIIPENTYTSFGQNLGHRIGPNADEIFLKLTYNFNERIRFWSDFSFVRKGKNQYDINGNLIKNVGGDIFLSHPDYMPSKTALFLDGERWNYSFYSLGICFEPVSEIIFDLILKIENELKLSNREKQSLTFIKLRLKLAF